MAGSHPRAWCHSGPTEQPFRSEGTAAFEPERPSRPVRRWLSAERLSAAEEMKEPLQGSGPFGDRARGRLEPAVGVYGVLLRQRHVELIAELDELLIEPWVHAAANRHHARDPQRTLKLLQTA